ncbi:MAG: sulfate/molybdate ABC transporter ATP-binding protein [Acidimicrobiales bacterium]
MSRDPATVGGTLDARLRVPRGERFVLDVGLTIEAGTTAALLGPNGSGKSTTVETLAGIRPVETGYIRLGDRTLDDAATGVFVAPEHRRVGVVFQRYLLFEHLDVTDNVAFGPASGGLRRREARAVARRWLDTLDLTGLAGRHPSELSGGQAQRVALARALAAEPDLLLLDEPLAALDVSTRSHLRRLLRGHLTTHPGPRGLITHDPSDAFLLAERIHVLEEGRIVQAGPPDELRRRPSTPYVAALAGVNLLTGTNTAGALTVAAGVTLHTADTHTNGAVLITIRPNAIALHVEEPHHGSPRNTWSTTVGAVEPLGEITRVTLGEPVVLGVDVTPEAARALSLSPGRPVWASVKATEISVNQV